MPVRTSVEISDRLEQLLAKAGVRDRAAIERRLALIDADFDRSACWCQFLVKLSDLVSLPVHPVGSSNALQFFIPDGKYRMQVFALDDTGNGLLILYMPDVLAKAVRNKLLVKSAAGYSPAESPKHLLTIEQMDGNTRNPPEFMKHMVGWSRKAMKLTLQISPPEIAQFRVAEQLCELAAEDWSAPATAS